MDNIDKTMKFDYEEIPKDNVETVLNNVHRTLELSVRQNDARNHATLIVTLSWKNSFQII